MKQRMAKLKVMIERFAIMYEKWEKIHGKLVGIDRQRYRKNKMSLGEMLLVAICFHYSEFRVFKYYYIYGICDKYRECFMYVLSYNRFIELKSRLLLPLSLLLCAVFGEKTGIYFADSTKIAVCHNKRTNGHKVFKEYAKIGKSSYGWFYGFKLHIVMNQKGQIVAVKITQANIDDRDGLFDIIQDLKGVIYADKGYLGQEFFSALFCIGIILVTYIRKNMKNILMKVEDKLFLRRRTSIIESAFNIMKNNMHLEHTRHRSVQNFTVNIMACLVAYNLKLKSPKTLANIRFIPC